MDDESDILCLICEDGQSEYPNEIVICDHCDYGYHQRCHRPSISNQVLKSTEKWMCMMCTNKRKSAKLKQPLKDSHAKSNIRLPTTTGKDEIVSNDDSPINPNDSSLMSIDDGQIDDHLSCCLQSFDYNQPTLQCLHCLKVVHARCLSSLSNCQLLLGDRFFKYICGSCNGGQELCLRITMKWSVALALTLTNLTLRPPFVQVPLILPNNAVYFTINEHIIPFLKLNSKLFYLSRSVHEIDSHHLIETVRFTLDRNPEKFLHRKDLGWTLTDEFAVNRRIFYSPFEATRFCKATSTLLSSSASSISANNLPPTSCSNDLSSPSDRNLCKSLKVPQGACRKGAALSPVKAVSSFVGSVRQLENANPTPNTIGPADTSNTGRRTTRQVNLNTCNSIGATNNQSAPIKIKLTKVKLKKKKGDHSHSNGSSDAHSGHHHKTKPKIKTKAPFYKSTCNQSSLLDLDTIIPMPDNFDGPNNPFYLDAKRSTIDRSFNSYKKPLSSHEGISKGGDSSSFCAIKSEYRILIKTQNTDSPKLVFSRVVNGSLSSSQNSSSCSLSDLNASSTGTTSSAGPGSPCSDTPTLPFSENSQNSNLENQTHFVSERPGFDQTKILARRITSQGVEYMIESEQQHFGVQPLKSTANDTVI